MNPLAGRSKPDGTPDPIPYGITESWGLIYNKGNFTSTHSHWPSTWGFVYTVQASDKCSPLIFDQSNLMDEPMDITPKTGQMILFPAWLNHSVPKQQCEHERIKVAGYRTDEWNGSISIPGFFYDGAKIVLWEPWTDYDIGAIVKYKEFYYAADQKIHGTETFIDKQWQSLIHISEPTRLLSI